MDVGGRRCHQTAGLPSGPYPKCHRLCLPNSGRIVSAGPVSYRHPLPGKWYLSALAETALLNALQGKGYSIYLTSRVALTS